MVNAPSLSNSPAQNTQPAGLRGMRCDSLAMTQEKPPTACSPDGKSNRAIVAHPALLLMNGKRLGQHVAALPSPSLLCSGYAKRQAETATAFLQQGISRVPEMALGGGLSIRSRVPRPLS